MVFKSNDHANAAREILAKHGISLDSHWNGVFLPTRKRGMRSAGSIPGARGAIHNNLHSKDYRKQLAERLQRADSKGGKAKVLQELQKIRSELVQGTFPSLLPKYVNF